MVLEISFAHLVQSAHFFFFLGISIQRMLKYKKEQQSTLFSFIHNTIFTFSLDFMIISFGIEHRNILVSKRTKNKTECLIRV